MNLKQLSQQTALSEKATNNIINLLQEGATIPFIARYRKDQTQGATDEQMRNFYECYQYQLKLADKKADIKRILQAQNQLNDQLISKINQAQSLVALDDIYLPFKKKRKTRAQAAIYAGLLSLADRLTKAYDSLDSFTNQAKNTLIRLLKTLIWL